MRSVPSQAARVARRDAALVNQVMLGGPPHILYCLLRVYEFSGAGGDPLVVLNRSLAGAIAVDPSTPRSMPSVRVATVSASSRDAPRAATVTAAASADAARVSSRGRASLDHVLRGAGLSASSVAAESTAVGVARADGPLTSDALLYLSARELFRIHGCDILR